MRASSVVLLAFVAPRIFGQDVFEPADFDVSKALFNNGVNVSDIPDLAGLAKRSLPSGCSIAVSAHHRCHYPESLLHKAYLRLTLTYVAV
jgi:hypothetical protein